MKKKLSLVLAALLALSALAGCGAKAGNSASLEPQASASVSYDYGKVEDSNGYFSGEAEAPGEPAGGSVYSSEDAKIIRTASMTIQTTAFEDALTALGDLTTALGGYYETAEVSSGGYYDSRANRSAWYVVRVPGENYNAFRDAAGTVGHVSSLTESSVDVGEQYYDAETRLQTMKTKQERLLVLLERAENMEDIITLESALADVQYEIDRYSGELRRYDGLIDYATFNVRVQEVVRVSDEPGVQDGFGSRLSASLKRGLSAFGEGFQDFLLWLAENLIGVLIFAAVVAAVVVIVRRRLRRRRAGRTPREN